jgi:Undecaprenyl-phosphate galactose phosphotransferase WbaP
MNAFFESNPSVPANTAEVSFSELPFYLRYARYWMSGVLLLTDLLSLSLAGWLAYSLRNLFLDGLPPELYLRLFFLLPLFGGVYALRGLYPAVGIGVVEEFRRLTVSTTLVFLMLVAFSFVLHDSELYSRTAVALAYLLALVLAPCLRILVRHCAVHAGYWGIPVAITGPLHWVLETAKRLRCDPKIGLRPAALFSADTIPAALAGEARVLPEWMIAASQETLHLETVLVMLEGAANLGKIRRRYEKYFNSITLMQAEDQFYYTQGVSACQFGGLTGLEIRQNLLNRSAQFQKRLIDILVAGGGLLALAPFLGVVALLIRLDSAGPVFYRQRRLGRNGGMLEVLKFRTMHPEAERILTEKLLEDPALREEWEKYQKLKNDPRITRVGRIIRRLSIDELPQLWNVFRGEMSLVGPRPIMLSQRGMYGKAFSDYVRVAPGLTGMWQISGRNQLSFQQRIDYDMQYILNWSVWLDIYILIRTIWVVLRCEGAG